MYSFLRQNLPPLGRLNVGNRPFPHFFDGKNWYEVIAPVDLRIPMHIKVKFTNKNWQKSNIVNMDWLSRGRVNPVWEAYAPQGVSISFSELNKPNDGVIFGKVHIRANGRGFLPTLSSSILTSAIATLNSRFRFHIGWVATVATTERIFEILRFSDSTLALLPGEEYKKGRKKFFNLNVFHGYIPKTMRKRGAEWGLIVMEKTGALIAPFEPSITLNKGMYVVKSTRRR